MTWTILIEHVFISNKNVYTIKIPDIFQRVKRNFHQALNKHQGMFLAEIISADCARLLTDMRCFKIRQSIHSLSADYWWAQQKTRFAKRRKKIENTLQAEINSEKVSCNTKKTHIKKSIQNKNTSKKVACVKKCEI